MTATTPSIGPRRASGKRHVLRPGSLLLCLLALSLPATGQPAPVPAARPAAPDEAPADADAAPEAVPAPPAPESVPVPEEAPARDGAAQATPSAETAPAGEAAPPAPEAAAPAAAPPPVAGTDAAPADAPAGAPEPAYVPPETARTQPEPGAPETPPSAVTPAEAVEAAAAIEDALACEAELRSRGAVFEVGPSVSDGACGVLRPVALARLSSGVAVDGGTQLLCRAALALDIWVADAVAPAAAAELGGDAALASIGGGTTYVCRDRAAEARISEHGRGSAVDIGALTLEDGRRIEVAAKPPGSPDDRFLAAIRRAACGPFKTVLGPGTDADHETHLHLDVAARANGSLYCR